jgi:hypothetical protein
MPETAVTIQTRNVVIGGEDGGLTVGGFSRDGDAGIASGEYRERGHGAFTASEVLAGREGMLRLRLEGVFGPLRGGIAEGSGHWVVIGGTGAFDGARGAGTWSAVRDFRTAPRGLPSARSTYVGTLSVEERRLEE